MIKQKFHTGNPKWPRETLSHASQVSGHGWERSKETLQKLKTLFPPQHPRPGKTAEQIDRVQLNKNCQDPSVPQVWVLAKPVSNT